VIGIDTNILVYSSGFDDIVKQRICTDLLESVPPSLILLPLQVLAELHRVISRKTGDKALASRIVSQAVQTYGAVGMDAHSLGGALELVGNHKFQIFDALILAQCESSGCEILLSEDMHSGFRWKSCAVFNPLAADQHQILAERLAHLRD
jgi:predicted nucleic acid-binding protein